MSQNSMELNKAVLMNWNTKENNDLIKMRVLNDTGRSDQFAEIKNPKCNVYFEKVTQTENPDAIISVLLDKKNTIIAVYTLVDDVYQYTTELGRFYEVDQIFFLPGYQIEIKMIAILENVDTSFGAFEYGTFLKCFNWNITSFNLVLNVAKDIKTYWNSAWFDQKDDHWHLVTLSGEMEWDYSDKPVLFLYQAQEYSISSGLKSTKLPDISNFNTVNDRGIVENFIWNPEWNRFILFEKLFIPEKEIVAVIQDLEMSPYSLVDDPFKKCVICNQQGIISIVDKNKLTEPIL